MKKMMKKHSILKKFWKRRKRRFLLLEVVIALMLVTLCAFPLIYPHVLMLKTERELAYTLKRDRAFGLAYIQILEELYENRIPWSSIENEEIFPVEVLNFEGDYQVVRTNTYKSKKKGMILKYFILSIKISLASSKREYSIFVEKDSTLVGDNEKKENEKQA